MDEALELLQALVRAGPDAQASAQVVQAHCRKGWRVERGPGFVWVQPEGHAPRLVLSGHVDVVPVGDGWTCDPFAAEVRGDEVLGRGTCDMKGAVAAMLAAARQQGEGDWALAFTLDEETGMAGAHRLADSGAIAGAELVVVGEPTELRLGVAHRGVLWTEVTVRGQAAHGSTPEKGRSAIRDMLRLLQGIEGFALPGTHPVVGGSSLNIGTLRGGEAVNMVPALCRAELDLRIPPPMPPVLARQHLEQALRKTGVAHELRVVSEHAPFEAVRGPLLDRMRHWLREANPAAQDLGLP
ncbi:MAG: M20/M25/M40 family metallo-hydrolase, partial [Halobacteriales archaeon]|nr:M20/M25/M40 family metallo-hydrolase [Halobacteriales archaeon]